MKRVLLVGAAVLLGVSAARAADIVEPAAYDWTGPYIGLQGGYGWGDNDVKAKGPPEEPALAARSAVTFHPLGDGSIDMDGFVGGLHAGYNWQSDSLVLGLEGDIEYANVKGDTDLIHVDAGNEKAGELDQDIDWLGSLRLRAGFAFDRALIYATGGLAAGGVKVSFSETGGDFDRSNKDTEWGWTIGGGLEYALTDDLSARIEYRYTDLGDTKLSFDSDAAITELKFDNTFHAVRAGLSWHF